MHPPILGGFALNDGTHSWFNEHELLNPTALWVLRPSEWLFSRNGGGPQRAGLRPPCAGPRTVRGGLEPTRNSHSLTRHPSGR